VTADQIFPTILSLPGPSALTEYITENYSFDTEFVCRSFHPNNTFLVTGRNGRYILRVYRNDIHWLTEKSHYQYVKDLAPKLRKKISEIDFNEDDFGIIGGDFHGDNHFFTKDNRLTHFDFELCSYGWRVFDLAVFRHYKGRSDKLWNRFLKDYQSIRPLKAYELESIPAFVIIRQIWEMGSVAACAEAESWLLRGQWDSGSMN
jgi:Ser/Thr protein kinase RdoA (MazF antagonist)